VLLCVRYFQKCGGNGSAPMIPIPAQSVSYTVGASLSVGNTRPADLVVADFNGHGRPDIALTLSDTNSVAIFLNQGAGRFSDSIITAVPNTNGSALLAVGDSNEDGKPDLVVGTQDTIVLLGNGLRPVKHNGG
jgi:hypothetical protein